MSRGSVVRILVGLLAATVAACAGDAVTDVDAEGADIAAPTDVVAGADAADAAPWDVSKPGSDASKPDAEGTEDTGALVDAAPPEDVPPPEDATPPEDTPVAPDVADAVDAGPMDAGPTDAGPTDVGLEDGDPGDTGPTDAGPSDTGPTDAGPGDTGPVDAGPVDAGPEDTGPPFEYPWQPSGPCGVAPYEWLPPEQVGTLVSWEPQPFYNLPPDTIQLLLKDLGYPGALPIEYGTRVYRIRYLTQDRGSLLEATAMIGVPDVALDGPKTLDTVLFLHPTVGYADQCAPSDGLYGGAAAVLPASLGYIAVAPDMLGMCGTTNPCGGFHPYLIGEPTAIASLDAVRAANELLAMLQEELLVTPSNRVVPWGGSQGGHAALFVDRYAPVYAPELEVGCVVAIVPPADLAGQALSALSKFDSSTKLGTAFLAAAVLWYDPAGGAAAVFNASGTVDFAAQVIDTFPTTCSDSDLVKGATSIDDLFAPGFVAAMSTGDLGAVEPWGCIALDNSLPTTSVPLLTDSEVLFVLGSQDQIVDHETELGSFQTLCTQGYRMELVDCEGASHENAAVDSLPAQVTWVASCLAGQGIPEELSCVVTPPVTCK